MSICCMPESRLEYLFNRYINQQCNLQEEAELMELISLSDNESDVKLLIDQVAGNTGSEFQMKDEMANSILQNILTSENGLIVPHKRKKIIFIKWMRLVAAAMIVLLGGSIYWFIDKKENSKDQLTAEKQIKILPGGEKAMLTMSDGRTIILDTMQNGTLAQQKNADILKKAGLLMYDVKVGSDKNILREYNTLSTPKGGQYRVILPDGSKVWLNAASSLRFPTAFAGNRRDVELNGEAYFEVQSLALKDPQRKLPFYIHLTSPSGERGQIEVLGTHFNVNAYMDEANIKTTLLEGAVRVRKGAANVLLAPGQQAQLLNNGEIELDKNADINEAMAWKNGLFQFKGADITTVMRQIGRWYNVDVSYSGKIPIRQFEGKISRNAQLSEVLQILELSNVKFTVEGKNIIVQ